jgi:hypothetical protein
VNSLSGFALDFCHGFALDFGLDNIQLVTLINLKIPQKISQPAGLIGHLVPILKFCIILLELQKPVAGLLKQVNGQTFHAVTAETGR